MIIFGGCTTNNALFSNMYLVETSDGHQRSGFTDNGSSSLVTFLFTAGQGNTNSSTAICVAKSFKTDDDSDSPETKTSQHTKRRGGRGGGYYGGGYTTSISERYRRFFDWGKDVADPPVAEWTCGEEAKKLGQSELKQAMARSKGLTWAVFGFLAAVSFCTATYFMYCLFGLAMNVTVPKDEKRYKRCCRPCFICCCNPKLKSWSERHLGKRLRPWYVSIWAFVASCEVIVTWVIRLHIVYHYQLLENDEGDLITGGVVGQLAGELFIGGLIMAFLFLLAFWVDSCCRHHRKRPSSSDSSPSRSGPDDDACELAILYLCCAAVFG